MNKKVAGLILILSLLLAGMFYLSSTAKAAEAAPSGKYLISQSRQITFYTATQSVFERLQERYKNYLNVKIVFKGRKPALTPTPVKEPLPTPQPQPAPAPQPTPDPGDGLTAAEQRMFDLVNQDRAAAGLHPLQIDMRLVRAARIKSQDMKDKGYFAHTSPDGATPWDLMKAQGVTFKTAGENIAHGHRDAAAAETAFMNSSGHRANILNKSFTHVGIGIVGNLYTQEFAGF